MLDLYANYDSDLQCTNLFDSIIHALCARSLPHSFHNQLQQSSLSTTTTSSSSSSSPPGTVGPNRSKSSSSVSAMGSNGRHGNVHSNGLFVHASLDHSYTDGGSFGGGKPLRLDILNRLAFDGVLTVLHSMANKCQGGGEGGGGGRIGGIGGGGEHYEAFIRPDDTSPSPSPLPVASMADVEEPDSPSTVDPQSEVDRWCETESLDESDAGDEHILRSSLGYTSNTLPAVTRVYPVNPIVGSPTFAREASYTSITSIDSTVSDTLYT